METADVLRVVGILAEVGVECWLDGGWAVDALVGRQESKKLIRLRLAD